MGSALIAAVVAAASLLADDLPRRGGLGLVLAQGEGAARIAEVLPWSPLREADVGRGDLVAALDGEPTPTPAALMRALAGKRAGARVRLRVMHGGEPREKAVTLAPAPREQNPVQTLYGAVESEGHRLRT